jgi:anti-sigma B factor antagonist
MAASDDLEQTSPLKLSHRTCRTGETVVDLDGELDLASAERAVSYVRDVIDRCRGPVIVDLTALAFCDARGLSALVRMAGYADQQDCPFRLASPRSSLVKVMRITGLDRRFLTSQALALGEVPPKGAIAPFRRPAVKSSWQPRNEHMVLALALPSSEQQAQGQRCTIHR